ncbi:MAG TPA: hypothetical protein VGI19_16305 [Candidatus Cybelea sp.]
MLRFSGKCFAIEDGSGVVGGDGGGRGAGSEATSRVGGGGDGGGGSSFVESTAAHVKDVAGGASPGNGFIVISW